MNNFKEKYNVIRNAYRNGFNTNVKTVILYLILSSAWILWSDKILELMVSDIVVYDVIQSLKGLFFVLITSMFLLMLLWKNYNTIVKLQESFEKSENKLNNLKTDINPKGELYHLMSRYLTDSEVEIDEIIIGVFNYIFKEIDVCDLGSVYKLEHDKIKFIDAVGYNVKTLNSLNILADEFELFTFNLKSNKRAEVDIEQRLGKEKYENYSSTNPLIRESMYIGLIDNFDMKLGISLDISENAWNKNKKSFDEKAIRDMKELQLLVSAMFKMKKVISVKDIIQNDIVNSFIVAMDYHDEYTKGHSESVAKISVAIGEVIGLSSKDLQELHWAGTVHDIGKIIIPVHILNKDGSLTDEEYDVVKKHPTMGEAFLSKSESLSSISNYVRHHHERWDGKGYPDGLKGDEIPFYSRIIGVADAYHAMVSDRPYRKGLGISTALNEINKNKGIQFCPTSVDAFMESIENGLIEKHKM